MLAYVLAIIIAIGSFSFYMAAFFVPEMHRRQDFIWSGLGMFYALVLWFCAGRITGAVLLGQTASVVLLGWLGYHTLELRRDLTPEPVRTPITWADLQHWTQTLQQKLGQYLRLGSVATGLQTAWGEINGVIADLRNRTAGPRGIESEVPPLKRSPAYEFETEAGEGQTIPSEFASVATRTRQEAEPHDLTPPTDEPSVEAAIAASESESLPGVEASPVEVPTEPAVAAPVEPPPVPTSEKAPSPATTTPAQATPPPKPTAVQPPTPKSSPAAGKTNWLGSLVNGFRKSKPPRGVVEIPPRAPSIPRSPEASSGQPPAASAPTQPSRPTKSQRGVIDIPPRPPSIPRSPKPTEGDSTTPQQPASTQSRPGRSSKPQRGVIDIPPRPPSIPRPPKPGTTDPAPPAPGPAADANWVEVGDVDDTPTTQPQTPSSPAPNDVKRPEESPQQSAEAVETNWPDDEETNWPD